MKNIEKIAVSKYPPSTDCGWYNPESRDLLIFSNGEWKSTAPLNQINDRLLAIEEKFAYREAAKECLTFEAVNDNTNIVFTCSDANYAKTIEVSTDKINWESKTSTEEGETLATLNAGEKLYMRGDNANYGSYDNYQNTILPDNDAYLYGNIMSLVKSTDFVNVLELTEDGTFYKMFYKGEHILSHDEKELILAAEVLTKDCYQSMFEGCTKLVRAPRIMAKQLSNYCCMYMFYDCSSLEVAPKLPATTLAEHCYHGMFRQCTSLVNAPELPATTLAESCYVAIFECCTSLVNAPELPATTLASECYSYMFSGCTSLVNAPELPATTLASECYSYMFEECPSLITAPELPATSLANRCYYGMFSGTNVLPDCSNIDFTSSTVVSSGSLRGLFEGTKVTDSDLMNILPINIETGKYWLPVTTLAYKCYGSMFEGCISLTTAPELPATALAEYCCYRMFYNCSSLTSAPELPATTLASYCYSNMFWGCTALTTAPELPATTLADYCYNSMFRDCIKLNSITCLATDISADDCLGGWVDGVSSTGTFVKVADVAYIIGVSGIPFGWTVENYQG